MRFKIFKHGGYGGGGLTVNGGNLSGPLILSRNPVFDLEAATKNYLDNALTTLNAGNLTSGTLPVSALPAMIGDLINTEGSSNFLLTNTGISPNSYTKVTVNSKGRATNGFALTEADIPGIYWDKVLYNRPVTIEAYGINDAVPASGGTLTGKLYLDNPPIDHLHAVNKSYIDTVASSNVNGINVGDIVKKVSSVTPSGFFKCNGGEVSKAAYPALYSAVGDSNVINVQPGNGKPWQQQYQINDLQSGDISNWTTGSSIPNGIITSQAIVTKNAVYLLGGNVSGSFSSNIYSASISADGTLGNWILIGNLPHSLARSQAIVTKNRVYLIGGFDTNIGYTSNVYTAAINADGTLGVWATGPSLVAGVDSAQAIVTKNRVYLLGGYQAGGSVSMIQTALINQDGTLGSWSIDNSLLEPLNNSQVVVTKNRVYLLGGNNSGGYISNVYTAVINSDGTLGTWSLGVSLPDALSFSQSIVTKNAVYLLGGYKASVGSIPTIYKAVINIDGTLGSWLATGFNLPEGLYSSQAIITNNRIHVIGGYTASNTYSSTVYTAQILGGLNDYSAYYDGTLTPTNPANFRLPDYSFKELPNTFSYIKY